MEFSVEKLNSLRGKEVFSRNGEKLGKLGDVYVDDSTGASKWFTVHTGLFGTKHAIVPLTALNESSDGSLTVPFDKEFVKESAHFEDGVHLSPEEEQRLTEYYSGAEHRNSSKDEFNSVHDSHGVADSRADHHEVATTHNDVENRDYSDESKGELNGVVNAHSHSESEDSHREHSHNDGDVAHEGMVLHEERAHVASERVETGEAVLSKHVVTEHQSFEVPVTREEVHVVREPLNEVVDHADFAEEEMDVVLHEERPVVEKEVVAVERVSLDVEEKSHNEKVNVDVSHEEAKLVTEPKVSDESYEDGVSEEHHRTHGGY